MILLWFCRETRTSIGSEKQRRVSSMCPAAMSTITWPYDEDQRQESLHQSCSLTSRRWARTLLRRSCKLLIVRAPTVVLITSDDCVVHNVFLLFSINVWAALIETRHIRGSSWFFQLLWHKIILYSWCFVNVIPMNKNEFKSFLCIWLLSTLNKLIEEKIFIENCR